MIKGAGLHREIEVDETLWGELESSEEEEEEEVSTIIWLPWLHSTVMVSMVTIGYKVAMVTIVDRLLMNANTIVCKDNWACHTGHAWHKTICGVISVINYCPIGWVWGRRRQTTWEGYASRHDDTNGRVHIVLIQCVLLLIVYSFSLITPSGLTSIPAGLETPEMIQLRKKKIEEAMEQR